MTGGKHERLRTAFELAQYLFHLDVGRAAVTRVHPPSGIAAILSTLEGAGQVDGRDDVPIRLGNTAKTMNGEGFK